MKGGGQELAILPPPGAGLRASGARGALRGNAGARRREKAHGTQKDILVLELML